MQNISVRRGREMVENRIGNGMHSYRASTACTHCYGSASMSVTECPITRQRG